jgi:hypothetical protein
MNSCDITFVNLVTLLTLSKDSVETAREVRIPPDQLELQIRTSPARCITSLVRLIVGHLFQEVAIHQCQKLRC